MNNVRGGFDSHAFPPTVAAGRVLVVMAFAAVAWCAIAPASWASAIDARAAEGSAPVSKGFPAKALVSRLGPWSPLALALPGMPGSPTAGKGSAAESLGTGRASGDTLPPPRLVTVGRTGRDSARATRDPRRQPPFEQPRWVMLRSLVVPGWGQLHNGSWIKALGIAGGEGLLGVRIFDDERKLRDLNRQVEEARVANETDRFNAAIDAYNHRLELTVARRWWLGGLLAYSMVDAYVDAHFKDFDIEFERDPALPAGTKPTGGRVGLRWHW